MMRFAVVLGFQVIFAAIVARIGKEANIAVIIGVFALGYINGNLNSIWWRQ